MLPVVRVHARYMVQSAGRRVQEHRAGRMFRRAVTARGLHGLDFEPVEAGPRLWYREILVLRAFVREERRARLQGLHGPPRLRYVGKLIQNRSTDLSAELHAGVPD